MQLRYQILPDFEGFGSEEAGKVKTLIDERAQKLGAWRGLKVDHERVRAGLNDAMVDDKHARAAALRSGAKDPGRPAEERSRAELARIVDEMDVLEAVIESVEADLSGALTDGKTALAEEAARKREEAADSYAAAHQALREAHDAYNGYDGLERWAMSPEAHFSPSPPRNEVLSLPDTLLPVEPDEMEGTVMYRAAG